MILPILGVAAVFRTTPTILQIARVLGYEWMDVAWAMYEAWLRLQEGECYLSPMLHSLFVLYRLNK